MRTLFRLVLAAMFLAGMAVAGAYWFRPGMDQYRAHLYQPPAATTGALTATWFGVTALLLRDGEHAVMVDPFFTRPEGLLNLALNREIAPDEMLIAGWLQRAGIRHLDAVLVSHSHFDHGMDAGVVARLTGAPLLGSESTANIGRGAGLPESQLRVIKPGEAMQYGPFKITFVESKHAGATGGKPTGDITFPLHPPARYLDYKLGGTYSIFIEHPQGTVLHHGSAGFIPGSLANRKADVVFLGVALIDNLDAYLRETVDAVGAKRVIPTHWDDFSRPLDETLSPFPVVVRLDRFFAQMARRPDLKVQTLEPGQRVPLFEPNAQSGL
jgi:L-ascorbate metabolism protein UlaG (beta-lactamase superfamily)